MRAGGKRRGSSVTQHQLTAGKRDSTLGNGEGRVNPTCPASDVQCLSPSGCSSALIKTCRFSLQTFLGPHPRSRSPSLTAYNCLVPSEAEWCPLSNAWCKPWTTRTGRVLYFIGQPWSRDCEERTEAQSSLQSKDRGQPRGVTAD